jgi:outer membrane protein
LVSAPLNFPSRPGNSSPMRWWNWGPSWDIWFRPTTGNSEEFPEHLKEFKIHMNRKIACLLVTLTFALTLNLSAQAAPAAAPATAAATTPGGAKVGIIDVQQVIVATNEGQRDFEALQKKFDPKRNELQGMNKEVDTLKSQLNTQGEKMNEEARAKLVKDIESKQKLLQRQAEDAQNEFQQEQNTIAQRILQKLGPVIDKYAKENGFSLLIDSSNPWPQGPVLWANQTIDISKAVVDQYNTVSGVAAPPKPANGAATPASKPAGVTPTSKPPAKPSH